MCDSSLSLSRRLHGTHERRRLVPGSSLAKDARWAGEEASLRIYTFIVHQRAPIGNENFVEGRGREKEEMGGRLESDDAG